MISIFNGRQRTLGEDRQSVFIQVDVQFRRHLHLFKGAKLAVFQAIALHSNEDGWAWPSYRLLSDETGYSIDTVSRALGELCDLEIDGHNVLLRVQYLEGGGRFSTNRYLLFPSKEEVEKFDGAGIQGCRTVQEKPYTEKPYTVNPSTNKNHSEQEPSISADSQRQVFSEDEIDFEDLKSYRESQGEPPVNPGSNGGRPRSAESVRQGAAAAAAAFDGDGAAVADPTATDEFTGLALELYYAQNPTIPRLTGKKNGNAVAFQKRIREWLERIPDDQRLTTQECRDAIRAAFESQAIKTPYMLNDVALSQGLARVREGTPQGIPNDLVDALSVLTYIYMESGVTDGYCGTPDSLRSLTRDKRRYPKWRDEWERAGSPHFSVYH